MRIDSNTFTSVNTLQDNAPTQRAGTVHTSEAKGDGVTAQLSPYSKTVSSMGSGDDIRQDRVAELKRAIDSGTYEVNATGIAGAMMDNMFTMRFTF